MRRLRLTRTTADAAEPILHEGAPAVAAAAALLEQVGRSVPQLAGFLAEPVIAEDRNTIDWYATIAGTAIPLVQLQGGDRTAAEERLQFRLGQLRALAAATGDPRQKALLEAAAQYPGADSVYVVGQEPVLTQWGSRGRRAAAAAVPAMAQAAAPAGAVAVAPASRSWLLPALLALLLLIGLLGWMGWMQREKLVAWLMPPEAVALDPAISMGLDLVNQLEAERKRALALRDQVTALRRQFEEKKLACVVPTPEPPPAPPPTPEKKVETPPPEKKVEAPKPEKKVEVQPKPVPPKPVEPKPVAPAPAPPQEVATAAPPPPAPAQACEQAIQERKSWDAPEVVFVIDASGSMAEDAGGETRLDAAKSSVAVIADNLPADVDTALVKFNGCNSIDNDYFIDRNALKQKVNALRPQGGTPLGRSMERAANILSKKKPTVMVVVTDGEDSCGEKDPCAVAAAAKASHPNMTINVVDVSGTGGGACIAQNGGGRVLPARTPAEIKQAMQQATYPTALPAACKGKP
jgi:Mg-chelatase subunit ChlD